MVVVASPQRCPSPLGFLSEKVAAEGRSRRQLMLRMALWKPDFLQLSLPVVSSNMNHGVGHAAAPEACEAPLALCSKVT